MAESSDRAEPRDPASMRSSYESSAAYLAGLDRVLNSSSDEIEAIAKELRDAPQVLETAIDLYDAAPDDVMFRWGVVYLASQIAAPGTTEWLTRLASRPLPKPTGEDSEGCEGPRDNEVLVSVMAVEGLAHLVQSDGREAVRDALDTIITAQSDPAVQSAAVVEALRLDPNAGKRIRDLLPADHAHFIDLELRDRPEDIEDYGEPTKRGGLEPPRDDEKGR
jgi:hypothetical protein